MKFVFCVLVVLCACYDEMCDWLNVGIYVVEMCYWDCALCSCWWEYVLLELRDELKWLNCLHAWKQIVKNDCDKIELWWNVTIWIMVKDQLFSSSLLIKFWWNWNEGNPKIAGTPACEKDMRRGLPQVKKRMGGDSQNWKRYEAGTPASEKENGRGLPQMKRDYEAGTPARKRIAYGRDSRKKKKCIWRGLPQEKEKNGEDSRKRKRNVYGGDSRNWLMIWYGGDSHKKRAGTPANVRGCEFDKQTWRWEKLASHD